MLLYHRQQTCNKAAQCHPSQVHSRGVGHFLSVDSGVSCRASCSKRQAMLKAALQVPHSLREFLDTLLCMLLNLDERVQQNLKGFVSSCSPHDQGFPSCLHVWGLPSVPLQRPFVQERGQKLQSGSFGSISVAHRPFWIPLSTSLGPSLPFQQTPKTDVASQTSCFTLILIQIPLWNFSHNSWGLRQDRAHFSFPWFSPPGIPRTLLQLFCNHTKRIFPTHPCNLTFMSHLGKADALPFLPGNQFPDSILPMYARWLIIRNCSWC